MKYHQCSPSKNIFHVLNLRKKLSQGLDNIVTVQHFMSVAFIELEVLRVASVVAPIVPNTIRKVMAMELLLIYLFIC